MSEEKLDKKPEAAPYAAGTGSMPVEPDRAAFERMSYRERVAFKGMPCCGRRLAERGAPADNTQNRTKLQKTQTRKDKQPWQILLPSFPI